MNLLLFTFWESVASGIIGSIIASLLTYAIIAGRRYYKIYLKNSKLTKIIGAYKEDNLYMVVPALAVRPDVINLLQNSHLEGNNFPLIKYGGTLIKSSKLLGYADVVSLKYVLNIVTNALGSKSVVLTDEDLQNQLDISFISFGGSSFYCTYVLGQVNNQFYNFNGNTIVRTQNPEISFQIDRTFDYGFIIKYRHENFTNRTWIIIAGLGESGTRGAGWYLSTHWEQLSKDFKDNTFGLVIRVNHGVDNSALVVDRINSPDGARL